ncbi:hypothetical protein MWL57_15280 [Escherichia coli]|nr:hypothetical protein [Escherichia coli]
MSKVFICAAIPDEQAIKEEGAVAVATAIEAGDERRARAKFTWQFLEQYPAAQDCAYKFLVCGNDSNLLIVFYVQIMPDDFVMQLHRF